HQVLRAVEYLLDTELDLLFAIAAKDREQPLLRQACGGKLGAHVTLHYASRAQVREQEIEHVATRLAALVDLQRRDAYPFSPDLFRQRIVAAGDRAARLI